MRFVQGPDEQTLTDGMFTQNITRRLNLTFGFQSLVTDGRYTNTGLQSWNARVRLRYNLFENFNILLSDFYTKTYTHVNGGVDLAKSMDIFEPVQAAVFDGNSMETISRHDLTLM